MENPNLPEELLIDIFSRVPAKSIGRCRCLSKSWNRNLSSSKFIELHVSRETNRPDVPVLVTNSDYCFHTINLEGDDVLVTRKTNFPAGFCEVVGTCNGLALLKGSCDRKWRRELLVVNALTLQQVCISKDPPPDDIIQGSPLYGFGYDSCGDDYKIVRLTFSFVNHDFRRLRTFVDVYSLKNGTWKRIGNSPYYHSAGAAAMLNSGGVFVNGAVHWLAYDIESKRCVIAAFDVATESFSEIPIPRLKCEYGLLASAGCLLIVKTRSIWVMKEYGQVNSWTKFPIIIPSARWGVAKRLFFVGGNEVVVLAHNGSLVVWNLREGTTKDLIVNRALDEIIGAFTLVETLVSPIEYDITR